MKKNLLKQLEKAEKLVKGSKFVRLVHNPFKYLFAICFKYFIYKINKSETIREARLFYGGKIKIALPASTDIFLTGVKSHDSEIRLTRFLIHSLKPGDHFLDIGAHFGYYSLLASELVGSAGKVYAFEPSSQNFHILNMNANNHSNIGIFKQAVSNKVGEINFYEFPNLYSEYSSVKIEQFEKMAWYKQNQPVKSTVNATNIDTITSDLTFVPKIIKIDVEGSEYNVLSGATNFLTNRKTTIAMEYVNSNRGNEEHDKAVKLLTRIGYKFYIINQSGSLETIDNINRYLDARKLESDNIIFK